MNRLPASPLLRDGLVGVAVYLVMTVELAAGAEQVEGPVLGHHLVNLLTMPAFALRRVAPLGSICIAALGFAVGPLLGETPIATPYLALLFLLGSLGWNASLRVGGLGVTVMLLAGLTYDLATNDVNWADLVVNVVIIVMTWLGVHLLRITSDRRVRTEIEADRRARDAVAAERSRIARDLHDSMAHALTLITLQAGSARERTDQAVAREALGAIEQTGREALADMHRFLDLIGPGDGEAPGVAHLPDLVDGVRRGGLDVELELDAPDLPGSVSSTVYRVVQESLTNVVRHSEARAVQVVVRLDGSTVITRVLDDGQPVGTRVAGSGRGIGGLRERLALFGGSLDSGMTPQGWAVEARIPLDGAS